MPDINEKTIIPSANQDTQETNPTEKKFCEYKSANILLIERKYTIKIKNKYLLLTGKVLINKFLILDLNEPNDFALFINLLFYFSDRFNYYSFFWLTEFKLKCSAYEKVIAIRSVN